MTLPDLDIQKRGSSTSSEETAPQALQDGPTPAKGSKQPDQSIKAAVGTSYYQTARSLRLRTIVGVCGAGSRRRHDPGTAAEVNGSGIR